MAISVDGEESIHEFERFIEPHSSSTTRHRVEHNTRSLLLGATFAVLLFVANFLLGTPFFCRERTQDSNAAEAGTAAVPAARTHSASDLIPIQARNTTYYFTELQNAQIQNYRNGTGLLLHIHLVHHAGTNFCGTIGNAKSSPSFACRIDGRQHIRELNESLVKDPRFSRASHNPWYANETSSMIELIRPYYHMISWEYHHGHPKPHLSETNWEDPNLISVILMRDPISRMIAGDGFTKHKFNIHDPNATLDVWWAFADNKFPDTNNFNLHHLSDDENCCQGSQTSRERLEEAQRLLKRFTFVLDLECLDEGMQALAEILGIHVQTEGHAHDHHLEHLPLEERFPYREVYDFLVDRNQLDMELYEWSKNLSLVRCADLLR